MSNTNATGLRCVACDVELDENEHHLQGRKSGQEHGLCAKCAQWLNEPIVNQSKENVR